MMAPIVTDETKRVAAVKRYYTLDTPLEAALDRLTTLAARLFSVPIACVTLIDDQRLWFKSAYGLEFGDMPRESAICNLTIRSMGVMVVEDAAADARLRNLPAVAGPPGIRFYAGAPLSTPDGLRVGTLCIVDTAPRTTFDENQERLLRALADTVVDEFELRLAAIAANRSQSQSAQVALQLADVAGRLQLSDDTLHRVLEVLPVGVWIADREGNIVHGNPAARAIWGGDACVSPGRHNEFTAWSLETGARIPAADWGMARAIRTGGTSLSQAFRIRTFDGKDKIIRNSAVPLRGPSGEIAGAIAVNEDITEQRRAEEALRQTRDELESLFDAAPLAIVSFDQGHRIRRWNRAAERMFGWRADEALGREAPFVPGDLVSEYQKRNALIRRGESFREVETRRLRKDGSIIEVTVSGAALHGPAGEISGGVALYADRTQRVASERALRESEDRYRNMVEHSPNAIFVHDHGRILYANPAAARLFHAESAAALIGADATQFVAPDMLETLRERTRRVIEQRAPAPLIEARMLTLDGVPIDVESVSLPLVIQGRDVVQVVIRDIGDRKRAEMRARATERNLAALADNLPALVAIKDCDSRYVVANRKFCEAVRCTAEEVAGKSDFDFFDEEAARRYRETDRAVMTSGKPAYMEKRSNFAGAPCADIGVILAPLASESGETSGLITLVLDLTEKRAMEAEIRRTEDWFRRAVQDAPIPIMIHAEDGRILQLNDAWSDLSGCAAAELSGVDGWVEQARVEDGPDVGEILRGFCALEARSETVEVPIRARGGKLSAWALTSAPLGQTPDGKRVVITMAMDVTDRRNLERQLAQAQKMEAIGQLAGGVAHDFNNLLTVISGYSSLLLQSLPDYDPDRQHVQEITTAADRAACLTRQLLAFSRKQVLQAANVDLNSLVRDSEKMLKRLIGEHIEIRLGLSSEELRVMVDAGQFMQVMMNLAVNARDAMAKGGRLTIETRAAELDEEYAGMHPDVKPGDYVEIAVSDTGIGIDRALLPRIFEPFFTTKASGSGTGLGLSTVYGIVRQSNGHIAVYSEAGRGTTFRVYLPRIFEAAPAAASRAAAAPSQGSETVLLVEDEPALRKLTKAILASSGYQVIEADNGGSALLACERTRGEVALMITDVVMPGMNGRELAARLAPLRPNMKVLFMSGYTDQAVVVTGALEGDVDFLQKPFTAEALRERVRRILDRR